MMRTLIFGAIVGLVGKKLYDSGKLDEFRNDLRNRLNMQRRGTADTPDSGPRTAPAPAGTISGAR